MSKPDPENPPYITISHIFGQHIVTKMEWDTRDGGAYQASRSKPCKTVQQAEQYRDEWAAAEHLGVR